MDMYGLWVAPVGPLHPRAMHVNIPGERPLRIQFVFDVVRCEGIHPEIHRTFDVWTGRVTTEIDGVERAGVEDLQRLMEGMRLLRKVEEVRRRAGGRRPIDPIADIVLRHWRQMQQENRDEGERAPTIPELCDRLFGAEGIDIRPRTLERYIARWRKSGKWG